MLKELSDADAIDMMKRFPRILQRVQAYNQLAKELKSGAGQRLCTEENSVSARAEEANFSSVTGSAVQVDSKGSTVLPAP
ncbi:MAG: hypothetical protein ACXWP5_07160 [Bdellovibrionota bacterium]